MNINELVERNLYIDEFKKEHVDFRKYPGKNLMVIKRKYGSKYSTSKPWLNYCRGLIIDYKNHKIVFIPPSKAIEVATLDLLPNNSNMSQMIDGTMINLFYFNNEWIISSRSNIGCTNRWNKELTFKQMFDECSTDLDYTSLHKEYTYSFVMRHTKNKIATQVIKNELILIETYHNLVKLTELPSNDGYSCMGNMLEYPVGFYKGCSVTDNNIRYKWISPEYKFFEQIKPNTNNQCLNYLILRKSGYLRNYLQVFPELRYNYDKYRNKIHGITQLVYQYYITVFIKKNIQRNEIPFCLRPVLYSIHDIYCQTKQPIQWSSIKQYIYNLEPTKLLFIMNQL